jgi:hypothetical protein
MSNEIEKQEKQKMMLEKHGWKLEVPANMLPEDDKASFGGGLRCFRNVYFRDDMGNKIKTSPKIRCGNPAIKGSFYCKKHGGGNTNALVHGKRALTSSLYHGAFQSDLGSLFDRFINDPMVNDLRPELATLRTVLIKFIGSLNNTEKIDSPKKKMRILRNIINDQVLNPEEKFVQIKEFCNRQSLLTDTESIDKIGYLCDLIAKITERMARIQNKEQFTLTPDGLKLLLRCIVELITKYVPENQIEEIKKELVQLSVRTQGDLKNIKSAEIIQEEKNGKEI